MQIFKSIVHGSEILVPDADGIDKPVIGFFTTVVVSAKSEKAGRAKALEKVRQRWKDDGWQAVDQGAGLELEIEEIWRISFFAAVFGRYPRKGYSFYI